ncbi:MAG: hypothetical protein WB392_04845 [Methanotrichaceae archaeon]
MATVEEALKLGADGVAIGRNIFQADDPTLITHRICSIVHKGMSAEESLDISSANLPR